jgi:hypothetical protein
MSFIFAPAVPFAALLPNTSFSSRPPFARQRDATPKSKVNLANESRH